MRIDDLTYKIASRKERLIPVIVQDDVTREVLMLAYANAEALKETAKTGFAHYWSRSRELLWKKGGTSGNVQRVVEILVDCDADALLYRVKQTGPACHLGKRTCFHARLTGSPLLTRKSKLGTTRPVILSHSLSIGAKPNSYDRGAKRGSRS